MRRQRKCQDTSRSAFRTESSGTALEGSHLGGAGGDGNRLTDWLACPSGWLVSSLERMSSRYKGN